jgi:hypothetical protein
MGSLYLVADRYEIAARRKLLDPAQPVEVWQDLYAPDIFWIGDDAERRILYGQKRESLSSGLFWMGEASKRALDGAGEELHCLLAVEETAVPIYYGPRLTDVESLPLEESLRARVLSAHGIAVAWVTYDRFGARSRYAPTAPTDTMFFLRRPRGRTAHLWRLFRTRPEAVAYMTEHFGTEPEAVAWAERLVSEDFPGVLDRFGRKG